jgi:hypothetical protein
MRSAMAVDVGEGFRVDVWVAEGIGVEVGIRVCVEMRVLVGWIGGSGEGVEYATQLFAKRANPAIATRFRRLI